MSFPFDDQDIRVRISVFEWSKEKFSEVWPSKFTGAQKHNPRATKMVSTLTKHIWDYEIMVTLISPYAQKQNAIQIEVTDSVITITSTMNMVTLLFCAPKQVGN